MDSITALHTENFLFFFNIIISLRQWILYILLGYQSIINKWNFLLRKWFSSLLNSLVVTVEHNTSFAVSGFKKCLAVSVWCGRTNDNLINLIGPYVARSQDITLKGIFPSCHGHGTAIGTRFISKEIRLLQFRKKPYSQWAVRFENLSAQTKNLTARADHKKLMAT